MLTLDNTENFTESELEYLNLAVVGLREKHPEIDLSTAEEKILNAWVANKDANSVHELIQRASCGYVECLMPAEDGEDHDNKYDISELDVDAMGNCYSDADEGL